MKSGKTIRSFSSTNGLKVILRTPKWEDLDNFLELINSLVDEKADILRTEKVSREEEIDFLSSVLRRLEKDEMFYMVAEVGGKVAAVSEISKRSGSEKHVGVIGIAVKNGFQDLGIGTEMMKSLVKQAEQMNLKVLNLTAFATNKRAIHVYEKAGFVQTGAVPKKFLKEGQYIDEIIMTKLLE
jgi:RimJ/RimL family protein N-acetyltransferase